MEQRPPGCRLHTVLTTHTAASARPARAPPPAQAQEASPAVWSQLHLTLTSNTLPPSTARFPGVSAPSLTAPKHQAAPRTPADMRTFGEHASACPAAEKASEGEKESSLTRLM